jgi:chromosome segregation ATPase
MDTPQSHRSDSPISLLKEIERLLAERNGERQHAQREMTVLRERASHLEFLQKQTERLLSAQGEQLRQRFGFELTELDARLGEKEREIQAVRESAVEMEKRLNAEGAERDTLLAKLQSLLEERNKEIDRLRVEVAALQARLAQRETGGKV